MNEHSDFWQRAFGGKDSLRLSIGARNFRIRKNKSSKTATFEYGDRIKISITTGNFNFVGICIITREDSSGILNRDCHTPTCLREGVEILTGLVLDCFQ
jgi:hypothetical protein